MTQEIAVETLAVYEHLNAVRNVSDATLLHLITMRNTPKQARVAYAAQNEIYRRARVGVPKPPRRKAVQDDQRSE